MAKKPNGRVDVNNIVPTKWEHNPLYYTMAEFYNDNKNNINPQTGEKGIVQIFNEGGSRSSKSFEAYSLLISFCDANRKAPISIYVIRQTLKNARDIAYQEDFVTLLKLSGLYYPELARNENQSPEYTLWGSTIKFKGLDGNEELGRSDIIYVNEALDIKNEKVFDNLVLRCEMLLICDWNPKYSSHFLFKYEGRFNTLFTHTTFVHNKFINSTVRGKILSYSPWDFKDFDFITGKWKCPIEERSINLYNQEQGTINLHDWMVYGEGIRCPEEGAVFKNINWIDEFPNDCEEVHFGLDFGYTCLSGDTLIETIKGEKRLDCIKENDYIFTSEGYKRVIKLNKIGKQKVVEKYIELDFGYRKIISTFDHKFKTDKEWKQLKDLQKGGKLALSANLMGKHTEDTQTVNTQTIFSDQRLKKGYIELFGNFIMGKLKKVNKFITLMEMRLITTSLTLLKLAIQNTQNNIISLKEMYVKMGSPKKIGMKEGLLLLLNYNLLKKSVNHADRNSLRQTLIKHIVPVNAIISTNIRLLNLMKRIFAHGVEGLSKEINILNKKLVQANAPIVYREIIDIKTVNEYEVDVYDLNVETMHEYFANGILVHNCDPSVLTKVGRKGKSIFIEYLTYSSFEDTDLLYQVLMPFLLEEQERRKKEAHGHEVANIIVACDSADKYKDTHFVRALNASISAENKRIKRENERNKRDLDFGKIHGIQFSKVKKPMITVRISLMKKFQLNVVKNQNAEDEFTNYAYMMIEGRQTNIPIDAWNHGIDSANYCIWMFWKWFFGS